MNVMVKKIFAVFMSAFLLFGCAACNNSTNKPDNLDETEEPNEEMGISILGDKKFRKGLLVRGLGKPIYGDDIETFGTDAYNPMVRFDYGNADLMPQWHLAQWASRYPFHDKQNTTYEIKNGQKTFNYRFTEVERNHYLYENQSKTFEVNTRTGEYRLALKASECYHSDRVAYQEWPHLLLEQDLCTPSDLNAACKISDSKTIRVKIDAKINEFVDHMGDRADYGLHSAMCLFYLYVANYDETARNFTDMLWFGIPIFDNRYVFSEEASFPDAGSKESATDKWIFNISSSAFFQPDYNLYDEAGKILLNTWRTVDVELTDLIRRAFNAAQEAGYMKDSKWDNLYINGMYTGYELPGTYDIDMSFKNIDIVVEKETE